MRTIKSIISLTFVTVLLISGCKKSDDTNTNPNTGNAAPAVATTGQANNSTGVSRNTPITVTFTKPMNPSTINSSTFIVMQGSTQVSGTIMYSGSTATFYPTNSMSANVNYAVTITTGATDQAGTAIASNTTWSFTTGATSSTIALVDLDTARNYVVLAKTAIASSNPCTITGNVGVTSGLVINLSGFSLTAGGDYATSSQVTGRLFATDMSSTTQSHLNVAANAMTKAYNDAHDRLIVDFSEYSSGNIGGHNLTPGLYKWTSNVNATSTVTLTGGANDVWIFQVAGDVNVSSTTQFVLAGGAQAKNVFWQVSGHVAAAANSHVEGCIMAASDITFASSSSLTGCAYSTQGSVLFDGNTVVKSN